MAENEAMRAAQETWKRAAARAAVASVPDGAMIGLGSGTTAEIMLAELAVRVRQGLRVTGVPTSERTGTLAAALGIPLTSLDAVQNITLSIDGADEVSLPHLHLVKGRGGASLREKLVAAASRFRMIIVDDSKLVPVLGAHFPVPVEVVPFGWQRTAERLVALGAHYTRRPQVGILADDALAEPFVTDGGHFILDCHFGPIAQPEALAQTIKSVTGVVDHGLFIGMTERVYVGGPDGVRIYDRR